ncbi:hypothetical protein BP5796_06822 [Coleophoma crateriformis]|uniref:Uncharacterized protein n=1 Tax=Coleophoma crateriformis TaxID=565419 RepID=A0A3D8RQB8_9HELO|nr:hypothetical protein BP5796_06822 [Coleophoma crateriformis]
MGVFNPAERQKYNPEQIKQYYAHINLPPKAREIDVSSIANTKEGLEFLTVLQRHQLASVPFENLELHYSSHHTISLDPQHLFHKIVERNAGRGGYCMENSCFFGTILRSLGYDIVSIGAKVNEAVQPIAASKNWKGPKFDGWNHMLNIVYIDGKRYVLDVGFGSSGPTFPLPLVENEISVNVGSQEMRLIYDTIPDFTKSDRKLWQYQHRNTSDQPWAPTYAFSELEFTPSDFMVMNHFTSTHRSSWFTTMMVCVKMVLEDGEIVGDVTLFGPEVKKRIKGKSELLAMCDTEEERIKALDEFLGVKLSETEQKGIHGLITELL